MLPYLVALVAVLSIFASLYKDRKVESNTPQVIKALRINYVFQFLVVALASYTAVDAGRTEERHRHATLAASAAAAGASHIPTILDLYVLKLLPASSAIRNYDRLKAALSQLPPGTADVLRPHLGPVMDGSREDGVKAFNDMQKIARVVLSESVQYGSRYPHEMSNWAARTLELREDELGVLLSDTDKAREYARLIGLATGITYSEFHQAIKQIEE